MRKLVAGALRGYQLSLSSVLGRNCRFAPTCSEYTREAVLTHGVAKGTVMGAWRICRCGPLPLGTHATHGFDPVPEVWHDAFRSRASDLKRQESPPDV